MDHPYYTVTVTNLTRGWAYTTTEGDTPDPADDVHLGDPLTYAWAFKDDLIPGQLETFTADVQLIARTASSLPAVAAGDLVTLDVRVGTAGQRIIAPPPMRVAAATVTLGPGTYKAALRLALSDLSVDWRARGVTLRGWGWNVAGNYHAHVQSRYRWLERMAEYAADIGVSVGRPSGWSGTEGGAEYMIDQIEYPKDTAAEELEALINSHVPGGVTYTWATVYQTGYPTGYQWAAPSSWQMNPPAVTDYAVADPGTTLKILPMPASRVAATAQGLPLVFVVVAGVLTLGPSTGGVAGTGHTAIALDAGWCALPTKARRAREGAVNTVLVGGTCNPGVVQTTDYGMQLFPYSAVTVTDAADAAARGASVREVPTKLRVSIVPGTPTAAVYPIAAAFLSDPSVDEADWSYDGFQLVSSLIPQATADWLLSLVAPRLPGEANGDGRLVKHVTIYDIDPDLRFNGEPVTGFITGGTMTIVEGDIVWELDTIPGRPQYVAAPAVLLVSEMVAAGAGLTIEDTDPLLVIADLAYVDH